MDTYLFIQTNIPHLQNTANRMASPTLNKIHVNNSTRISLNDRFSILQSVAPPAQPAAAALAHSGVAVRRRSRSRSRSRSMGRAVPMMPQRVQAIVPAPPNNKASVLYRYHQRYLALDKGTKMAMALRLKRVS